MIGYELGQVLVHPQGILLTFIMPSSDSLGQDQIMDVYHI